MKLNLNPRAWILVLALLAVTGGVVVSLRSGDRSAKWRSRDPVADGPSKTMTKPDKALVAADVEAVDAWWEAPRFRTGLYRDPFGEPVAEAAPGGAESAAGPVVTAVWRQDGARMALVEGRVIAEGELYQGRRLLHCAANAVWFEGTFASHRYPVLMRASVRVAPRGSVVW